MAVRTTVFSRGGFDGSGGGISNRRGKKSRGRGNDV
jgi:hypothetical protein